MVEEKTGSTAASVAKVFLSAVAETPRAMLSPWVAGIEAAWRDIARTATSDKDQAAATKKQGVLKHR